MRLQNAIVSYVSVYEEDVLAVEPGPLLSVSWPEIHWDLGQVIAALAFLLAVTALVIV